MSSNSTNSTQFTCRPFLNEGPAIWAQYPPAAFIIIVLSFMQKRKYMHKHCNGFPGWIFPVNLVEVGDNRFGYAMAFGASTTAILALFTNQTFASNYWLSVLLGIFIVFRVTIIYYPLFACLSSKFALIGSVFGFLHTASITTIHILGLVYCPSFRSLGAYSNVILNIPIFICLAWLECHFGYLIIKAIYDHIHGIVSKSKPYTFIHLKKYQYIHVKLLLKAAQESDFETEEQKKPNAVRAFFIKYLYKSKPHFRYPPRIICTFVVTAIALYEVTVMYYYLAASIFDPFESWVKRYSEYLTIVLNASRKDNLQFVYNCRDTWIVVTFIASSINAVYLSHMLIIYRINKFRLYRGDKVDLPIDKFTSFGSVIQSSICYAGYQISYMIWAFIAVHGVLFLGILFVIYCIIYPLEGVGSTWFLDFVIPIATCTILINIWQFLMSKYFFCQERGAVNALDNRRIYHNFAYFIFFYNVMCGFFSCLFRIGKSIILGLLLLSRMDCSLLMKPFELFDSGFDGYLGFMFVEHIHCHPILVTFCEILLNKKFLRASHDMKVACYGDPEDRTTYSNENISDFVMKNKQAFNRWHVAVLLIRNKSLRKLRSSYLEELREIDRLEAEHCETLAVRRRRKLSGNSLLDAVRLSNVASDESDTNDNKTDENVLVYQQSSGSQGSSLDSKDKLSVHNHMSHDVQAVHLTPIDNDETNNNRSRAGSNISNLQPNDIKNTSESSVSNDQSIQSTRKRSPFGSKSSVNTAGDIDNTAHSAITAQENLV